MIISKEECAKLSYYRTELMGAAIIMVMFCHNTIQFSENALNLIWKSFSSYFQVGVDIFFLLSGLGCVFSLQKTSGYSGFMKRRIWRIIPTYLVVDGGWCLFQKIIWMPQKPAPSHAWQKILRPKTGYGLIGTKISCRMPRNSWKSFHQI